MNKVFSIHQHNHSIPLVMHDSGKKMRTVERQAVLDLIEQKLQLQKSKVAPAALRGSLPVHGVARALDRCLYQSAPNFEAYADPSTLDERLRELIAKWMQRRRKECSQPCSTRKVNILKKVPRASTPVSTCTTGIASNGLDVHDKLLGDRRAEVMELVQEIQTLKLERARIGCASCGANNVCNVALSPQQPLPPPVRNLFFNTSLVSAVERGTVAPNNHESPESDPCSMPWEAMIQQARKHLQEYKEWCNLSVATSCPINRVPSMESVASF